MFYLDCPQMEQTLRFGDVIQGFPVCFSVIDNPSHQAAFNIAVSAPTHAVVLSPCCSIKDKVLAIAPLKQLENSIFTNPYWAEDPTRINIKIPAEKSLPPFAWDKMAPEEKANRLAKGENYALLDEFVYAPNELFNEYTVNRKDGNIQTRYYCVDFRDSIKIHCDRITNSNYSPGVSKILQLSVETRELLRKKIVSFYERVPDVDAALLAS